MENENNINEENNKKNNNSDELLEEIDNKNNKNENRDEIINNNIENNYHHKENNINVNENKEKENEDFYKNSDINDFSNPFKDFQEVKEIDNYKIIINYFINEKDKLMKIKKYTGINKYNYPVLKTHQLIAKHIEDERKRKIEVFENRLRKRNTIEDIYLNNKIPLLVNMIKIFIKNFILYLKIKTDSVLNNKSEKIINY